MASAGEDYGLKNPSSSSLSQSLNLTLEKSAIPIVSNANASGSSSKSEPRTPAPAISYHECLKNHAANIGGRVTDGCGEFMPSGEEGTLEALKCAACSCHRNFHRKYNRSEAESTTNLPLLLPPPLPSPSINQHRGVVHWNSMVQPVQMVFAGGSVGTDSSSEELDFNPLSAIPPPHFASKKRHRTKFTAEQKVKMLEFAQKLGWRIPREDDTEVQRFCAEVGVKRHVFKVWMHNNKIPNSQKNSQEM